MNKFQEMLEEALIESFPMFDFANADGDDELHDSLMDGVTKLDDCIGAYFEFASYGSPGGWGYGSGMTARELELEHRVAELQKERDVALASILRELKVQSVKIDGDRVVAVKHGW